MHTPHVYIVVLNYLQWKDTRDCLESLLRSHYAHFSILVIDNNSGNRSLEQLIEWIGNSEFSKSIFNEQAVPGRKTGYRLFNREQFNSVDVSTIPLLAFIQNDSNAGFAGGNNLALRLLAEQHAYVWLLNPDMIVKEDTLPALVNFATQQPLGTVTGAEIRSWWGNRDLLFYGGGKVNYLSATVQMVTDREKAGQLDYISGGCLFTHASAFKNNGLLPEDYFLYWEETDWCCRARQQGSSLLVCPGALCYDKISTVIGKGYLADYYYTRNGLLFISRFRKRNIPIALAASIGRLLKRIVTGRWARARGVYKGTVDFLKRKFNVAQ